MSAKVSLLAPVKIGSYKYLFLIVGWNDYATQLKEEMVERRADPIDPRNTKVAYDSANDVGKIALISS